MVKFAKKVEKKFTPYWEQRQLEDAVEDYVVKTTIENQYPILTSSQQKGIILQEEYFSGERTSKSGNIGYFILPRGYFAYRSRSDNDTYVFNRNDCIDKGIISYFYPVFRPKNTDSNFLLRRLNTGMQRQLLIASEGTGQHVLSLKKFKNMKTNFPCIEEQQKVGELFQSLDRTITLHEEKQKQLEQLKKALLQKMFVDKTGYPELRFNSFNKPWEQVKLGAIYRKIRNAFVGTATPFYVSKGHFYLESNNVKEGKINTDSQKFINDTFYIKQRNKWLHTGDIVMVQSGDVGQSAVIPPELNNSAAHALIMFQEPKMNVDPRFLNVQFQGTRSKKQIGNITKGNTIKHILASDMQKFVVLFPDIEEQQSIGQLFQILDHIITLHTKKIEELKQLKQALLQQMFI